MEKNLEISVLTYDNGKPECRPFTELPVEQILGEHNNYKDLEAKSVYGTRTFTISVPDYIDF